MKDIVQQMAFTLEVQHQLSWVSSLLPYLEDGEQASLQNHVIQLVKTQLFLSIFTPYCFCFSEEL